MATKTNKPTTSTAQDIHLSEAVKDSAQQIWQAGLGAFTRAQAEGTKAFEALVQEGISMQRKTQAAAEEKLSEATQKMTSMASDITNKATGSWDKLETIFEDRVAKAMAKLGVPSASELAALNARVDALTRQVEQLQAKPRATTKPVAAKTASKPRSPRAKPKA